MHKHINQTIKKYVHVELEHAAVPFRLIVDLDNQNCLDSLRTFTIQSVRKYGRGLFRTSTGSPMNIYELLEIDLMTNDLIQRWPSLG